MKAVDPTIKVGAVLTLPGNWPDGVRGHAATPPTGTGRCCRSPGSAVDFVIVHWYPNGTGAATALTEPAQLPGELAQLRRRSPSTPAPNGSHLGVALTEVNAGVDEDTQPDALFGADTYFTALEQGVFTVDWWDTHNGATRRSAPRPTAPPTYRTGACCPAATLRRLGLRAGAEHAVPDATTRSAC